MACTGNYKQMCVANIMFETEMVRNEAHRVVRGFILEDHVSRISINSMLKAKLPMVSFVPHSQHCTLI